MAKYPDVSFCSLLCRDLRDTAFGDERRRNEDYEGFCSLLCRDLRDTD